MTDDLVQRLRSWERGAVGRPALYDEAADALERLQAEARDSATMRDLARAEVVRLQQALRDLLEACEKWDDPGKPNIPRRVVRSLAAARAVLEGNRGD